MASLKRILSEKTDKELLFYIQNPDKHTPEAVELAFVELQKRNITIPALEQFPIEQKLPSITPQEAKYYSQTAIYIFSILCSTLWGTFMLAYNCRASGRPVLPVLISGLFYTFFFYVLFNHLDPGIYYKYLKNAVGTVIMYEFFWKQHLSPGTKYAKKSILAPLIIALVWLFLFLLTIYGA
jgi:hypothetical protein